METKKHQLYPIKTDNKPVFTIFCHSVQFVESCGECAMLFCSLLCGGFRFGPYICYKKANYKIPKGKDAKELTLADCREIVADEANASKASVRRAAAKKTTRKATTRKTATKKAAK